MRPYAEKLRDILFHCEACFFASENPLISQRSEKRVLILIITSNRGLCGSFNVNVAKKSLQIATELFAEQMAAGNVDFLTIGKKGADYLKARGYKVNSERNDLLDPPSFGTAAPFGELLMEQFLSGNYDRVELVYNSFRNALVQSTVSETLLPLSPPADKANGSVLDRVPEDLIIEPSAAIVVERLIPKLIKTYFYKALLDSFASEHGARMTAMHKASDNASQLISELRLTYNKARQSTITNEIIEIVGGAESLGK
jgi:F-type H+-transporting ATPase subunit gamma